MFISKIPGILIRDFYLDYSRIFFPIFTIIIML